ncbi:unnamed protein product [Cunninghamella blakesleeana]
MKTNTLIVGLLCLFVVSTSTYWFLLVPNNTKQQNILVQDDLGSLYGDDLTQGKVIMNRLNNATIKAELGRSTWKLIHTMVGRYPETPTAEERKTLNDFIYLFSRLYPCGECAEHFQKLLEDYPPQTSSRIAASQWACAIHNKVNERLKKPIFDCSEIEAKYPCGCELEKN